MVERFEPFFYVASEGVVGSGRFGEGGEGVPEEMVVMGLCSEVVESCIGRTTRQ